MTDIQTGKSYTLLRSAFILKGVIIQHHSTVEVISQNSDNETYTVRYIDKEGYQHTLENIKTEELSL